MLVYFVLFLGIIFNSYTLPFAWAEAPSPSGSQPEPRPQILFQPKVSTATTTPPASPLTIPPQEEVKILREERKKRMPYIDMGYVKETIGKEAVVAKQIFSEKENKALGDLVTRALQVYTPAKASQERISLSRSRIRVALRELLPGGDFNFEYKNGSLSGDAFSARNYHVKFKIPVFRGGILWNTFLREKAEYRAAKREYEAILNQLVDEVSVAYFEFSRANEGYEDKKKLAETGSKQHKISQEKFRQGLTSEIEYLNVESIAGQIQYDLETAKQELELAKLELERFLEVDSIDEMQIALFYDAEALIDSANPEKARVAEVQKSELALGKGIDELVDLAYQNRPELQVEAHQLRSARLEEKIRRGTFWPRVDLTMEMGEVGEAFTRISKPYPLTTPEWELAVEVSQNLLGSKIKYTQDYDENAPTISQFLGGSGTRIVKKAVSVGMLDGLGDFAELKEAQVKKLDQVAELEKKEQEVVREVKEAFFDFQKAKIQVESSLKRNQYRKKLVALNKQRLDKAEIEISEYLQAEIDAEEERGKLHRALADLFKAKSKLNRAIGIRNFFPMEERYGF